MSLRKESKNNVELLKNRGNSISKEFVVYGSKIEKQKTALLYDHYKTVFVEEPVFSLKLKKDVLPSDMKSITTFVFKPTDEMPF